MRWAKSVCSCCSQAPGWRDTSAASITTVCSMRHCGVMAASGVARSPSVRLSVQRQLSGALDQRLAQSATAFEAGAGACGRKRISAAQPERAWPEPLRARR